jgi:hypothetical protein
MGATAVCSSGRAKRGSSSCRLARISRETQEMKDEKTPQWITAMKGRKAVVKLLLVYSDIEVNFEVSARVDAADSIVVKTSLLSKHSNLN